MNRDELSTSLMLAFASTPLFEPFAVPLLLEKLSSSLPSAKVESLRYLSYCSMKYGSERMAKHIAALWPLLKETIQYSLQPTSSMEAETFDGVGFQENLIVSEALKLLQKVVQQDDGLFSSLIVGDEEINSTIKSISSFKKYVDIPTQNKHKLHAVGRILSVSAGASVASCNRVFESFFQTLMDALGLSGSSGDGPQEGDYEFFEKLNYGALFLCIELLDACKHLVVSSNELNSITVSPNERWCCILQGFCGSLIKAFSCALMINTDKESQNAYIRSGVKGLQILATLPGNFLPVSKSIFENILKQLMSVITLNFNKSFLWKLSLKALVEIGLFVDTCHESDKAQSFKGIVVEKSVFLISSDDSTVSLSHKLEAISEIGRTGLDSMLTIVKGLENTIFAKLSAHQVQGTVEIESTIELLECFSNRLLPWFDKIGDLDEVPFHFVLNFWDHIEKSINFSIGCQEKGLLDPIMTAMKQAVAKCSEKSQSIIIQRAFYVFMSTTSFPLKDSMSVTTPAKIEASGLNHGSSSFLPRDEWIISLLASVIIALRPETHIPNIELILQKFTAALLSGNVPAAQALGSIVNKLPLKVNTVETSDGCSLEEALDIIYGNSLWTSDGYSLSRICGGISDGSEIGLSGLRLSTQESWLFHVPVVVGLAWIGKGLLMRGHEKVKDITMTIWSSLLSNGGSVAIPCPSTEQDIFPLMKSAADAFHVLMSDSEACLNRSFHAIIRPLYKQRYFSTMMPIMLSSVAKSDSSIKRSMLHRAFVHILSDTPLSAVLTEAKKLISVLVDSLSVLSKDILNKDILYNALLVLSGILMDKNGQEAVVENAHIIIDHLIRLTFYPHMMLVRETAIQCLVAMSTLPHARIYPLRTQVLRAISNSLDDPKRAVRQEAVRCRQAWASIAP